MIVEVQLLAIECELRSEEGVNCGQIEGLWVIDGPDCSCGDAADDLPDRQCEEQAENGTDCLADI